ncbi:IS701 family transposase [Kitasatospora mediocidica]|uniref:IS701 family transposase n=1 Tax=Kitasatospora mediocidica TaxID=58352 RepID=UPI00055BF913|nr:transposase [Kitasatospora mediocidica]
MGNPGLHIDASSELAKLVAPLFSRSEPRRQALAYIDGLLNAAERGNSRLLAEHAGAPSVWSTQRLLTRARWDAEELRDRIRDFLGEQLGRPSAQLVLCQYETRRTGNQAVAVARQSTERDPRPHNSQVAVLLCYVSPHGSALVDRELFLPPEWAEDPARCADAGIPEGQTRYRSKAALGREMAERASAGGLPFSWVVGGPGFGRDSALRDWLRRRRLPYVLELPPEIAHLTQLSFRAIEAPRPAGINSPHLEGSWQVVGSDTALSRRLWGPPADGFRYTVLLSRNTAGDEHVHLVHAPEPTPLVSMAYAVLSRRTADLTIRRAEEDAGLGSHQVRGWVAWYRHTTLALAAAAVRETRPTAHRAP